MSDARHAPPRLLVADDQSDVLTALRMLLDDEGYAIDTVERPDAAVEHLRRQRYDLLLMDLNYTRDTTSGEEGLALLARVREQDERLPVVVMTAFGNVEIAVRAMQLGARDFVEKPWDNLRLLRVIAAQLDLARSRHREQALEAEVRELRGRDDAGVIAESDAMRDVMALAQRVAPSDATVLITGENGVGKGLLARAIHGWSTRAERPLLTVDLGTLSGGLVEAELFGHEAGAFTDAKGRRVGRFELADGATLLLDEIANCPLDQQSRLLRVIESGEFERLGSSRTRRTDVRLLCATNADLHAEVGGGRFRRDLFYRVNTVEIAVPALRERPQDIMPLADHFLERLRSKYRRPVEGFDAAARSTMQASPWPGNVRELAHAVERAVLLCDGAQITATDLQLGARVSSVAGDGLDGLTLDQLERRAIERAIERSDGNVRTAAAALGVSRSALYRRLERHGLSTSDDDAGDG